MGNNIKSLLKISLLYCSTLVLTGCNKSEDRLGVQSTGRNRENVTISNVVGLLNPNDANLIDTVELVFSKAGEAIKARNAAKAASRVAIKAAEDANRAANRVTAKVAIKNIAKAANRATSKSYKASEAATAANTAADTIIHHGAIDARVLLAVRELSNKADKAALSASKFAHNTTCALFDATRAANNL